MKLLIVISYKIMYYNPTITRPDLLERLLEFDDEVFDIALKHNEENKRCRVEIVGSACLLLNEINIPATEDIDVIRTDINTRLVLMDKYLMNTRSQAVENYMPYNYQDRLVKFNIDTKIVDYYILSLEDTVVCKLVAARPKDDAHLEADNIADKIHWPTLKMCMEEMKLSLLNINDYKWMVNRYNNFVRRNNHEEVIIENI